MIRSICDLSDDHPALARTVDPVFRDFGGLRAFHGRIATLRCHEDNLLLRQTLSTAGEGRVMVVDGGGSLRHALVGDKLGALLLQHGCCNTAAATARFWPTNGGVWRGGGPLGNNRLSTWTLPARSGPLPTRSLPLLIPSG